MAAAEAPACDRPVTAAQGHWNQLVIGAGPTSQSDTGRLKRRSPVPQRMNRRALQVRSPSPDLLRPSTERVG